MLHVVVSLSLPPLLSRFSWRVVFLSLPLSEPVFNRLVSDVCFTGDGLERI